MTRTPARSSDPARPEPVLRHRPAVRSRRPWQVLAAGVGLSVLVAVAGCGQLDPEEPTLAVKKQQRTDKKPRKPHTPSPTISESPSPTPSPSPEPSPTRSGPVRLPERLLTAAELPGFNDQFTWTEGSTGKNEPSSLAGTCHQFQMLSIGAMKVAYRDYQPAQAGDSTANHLVAEFADEKTAWRAFEVLKSWRGKCDKAVQGYDSHEVGELQDVPVEGTGHWYMLGYGPAEGDPESVYFDAQGLALVGKRIAVLRMRTAGQDYNYENGQEPMVAAVQAAAKKLS